MSENDPRPCGGGETKNVTHDIESFQIGGLDDQLKKLKNLIIIALMKMDVLNSSHRDSAQSILLHGPPGNGKTLTVTTTVKEINQLKTVHVTLYMKNAAEILNQGCEQSQIYLNNLFEKAKQNKPSVIFFDGLEELIPVRNERNAHIYSSTATTLVNLIQNITETCGVVVIGAATHKESINKEFIDREGFQQEIYFPLPDMEERRQILKVHTRYWKYQPNEELLDKLMNLTNGFSGAEVQALCCAAMLYALRRSYRLKITRKFTTKHIKIKEIDFDEALLQIFPTIHMPQVINHNIPQNLQPLLRRSVTKILDSIKLSWPHFLNKRYIYQFSHLRSLGKLVLLGNNAQCLHSYILPSILKELNHIPTITFDMKAWETGTPSLTDIYNHVPIVVIFQRIDEWWNFLHPYGQTEFISVVDSIQDYQPMLIIVTCKSEIPKLLQNCLCGSSSVVLEIEKSNGKEKEDFLSPLFFDVNRISLLSLWNHEKIKHLKSKFNSSADKIVDQLVRINRTVACPTCKRKRESISDSIPQKRLKLDCKKLALLQRCIDEESTSGDEQDDQEDYDDNDNDDEADDNADTDVDDDEDNDDDDDDDDDEEFESSDEDSPQHDRQLTKTELKNTILEILKRHKLESIRNSTVPIFEPSTSQSTNADYTYKICNLWDRAAHVTSKDMSLTHIKYFYDILDLCIFTHQESYHYAIENLENILQFIENNLDGG